MQKGIVALSVLFDASPCRLSSVFFSKNVLNSHACCFERNIWSDSLDRLVS
jgi:hypothetical protein